MKFTAAVSIAVLAALVVAVPTPSTPTRDAAGSGGDPMAGVFLNLMKDLIVPQAAGGDSTGAASGEDKLIKDMFSAVTAFSGAGASHAGSAGTDPMAAAAKLMTSVMGAQGGAKQDPMAKMFTSLMQAAVQPAGGNGTDEEGTDPLLSMATTAAKAFVDGLQDQSLEEQSEPGTTNGPHKSHKSENDAMVSVVKLLSNCLQAAVTDKNGDPVGAVMNVVLADPMLGDNPIIVAIKAAVADKTGDPLNAMIDSLMDNPDMQNDPYVQPILRIAKNVIGHLPKDGDQSDPLLALLNALAPPPVPKNPHAPKQLASPDISTAH